MFKQISLLSSTLFLGSALAHSGHNHNAWHSGFIHLLWVMPAVVLFAFIVNHFLAKKKNK